LFQSSGEESSFKNMEDNSTEVPDHLNEDNVQLKDHTLNVDKTTRIGK